MQDLQPAAAGEEQYYDQEPDQPMYDDVHGMDEEEPDQPLYDDAESAATGGGGGGDVSEVDDR